MLKEVRTLAASLSRGDLSGPLPGPENELAANLKSLHAALKHLTWQTREVAAGDYDQHIEFMGDFADAFNQMVAQLRERQDSMLHEIEIIQKQRRDLERSNNLFEIITGRMSEWIIMIDRGTGNLLFSNHPIRGGLANDAFESQLYDTLLGYAREINENDEQKTEEFSLTSDTAVQWFSVILYPVRWYEHNAMAAVLTDITSSKAHIQQLEDVAYRDMLTRTYNRHYGMKLLNEWIERHISFAICFIDMDWLKYVNDVFGHEEGDRYILHVANLLQTFSADCCVCRLGGDEFMVLAPGFTAKAAEERLETLRNGLIAKDYMDEDGKISYKCSMSYGVVEVTANNMLPASDLLSLADEKMYAYKRAYKLERRDAPA
ncbi:MAG: GGDEF domain-containing protein [Candidatus Accumulibacter sp.]|nr:GGDEF domain-containing protein [Accumulibacter sp.]